MKQLQINSTGPEVAHLQELLIQWGYQVTVDGIFSPETEKAVKDFQKKHNLTVDGVVFTQTWNKLLEEPIKPAADLRHTLLKSGSRGEMVRKLQELLNDWGYLLVADGVFGNSTLGAVIDFQTRHALEPDGVVFTKTWDKLLQSSPSAPSDTGSKFLSEADIADFAREFKMEVATVKAVRDVESNGRGFLFNGLPVILFERHVFWKQLQARGIDPVPLQRGFADVLGPNWAKSYYLGGAGEWDRLNRAISISSAPGVAEAAYASASYGLFQIMGYHFLSLGFETIHHFLDDMKTNERLQLQTFGKFLVVNNLLQLLNSHNWSEFARRYNGPKYRENQYDTKLNNAYAKYAR